jgi:uncharacterized protein
VNALKADVDRTYAPIETGARISALDALRGVALFGILLANVRQMFLPWDISDFPVPLGVGERLAWIDWQFYHALVDLKFLTLFSLLFGIGFALQSERLTARGVGFVRIYLRRVLILAMFGIAHALLLYTAEVLFAYALTGLVLLLAYKASADNQFRMGLALLGIATVWEYQLGSLDDVSVGITALTAVLLAAALIPLWQRRWKVALGVSAAIVLAAGCALTLSLDVGAGGPGIAADYRDAQNQLAAMRAGDATAWPVELRVRRQGGFAALVGLHARQFAGLLLYIAVILLWRTLGLFMIGAALFRSGVLTKTSPEVWRRVARFGLGIGLPLSVVATWLQGREMQGLIDRPFPEFLHDFSALPLSAGIAGAVFVLQQRGTHRWVWDRVEAAGRMALTNYIGQSLTMAAIAEPWGLNLYARLGGPALTALAVLVFLVLTLLSYAWLGRFALGPLESLWRCGTYWRWLPNARVHAASHVRRQTG